MIGWDTYPWFAAAAAGLLACAWAAAMKKKASPAAVTALLSAAAAVLAVFIAGMWARLGRPPLRTMGETRLWYAFFLVLSTIIVWKRNRYKWIVPLGAVMAAVFMAINLLRPEIHDRTLAPALQSGWFVPHVTVYMFSYALLGCSFIAAVAGLALRRDLLAAADGTVYAGTAFFTVGMLLGALWARQAWGAYWSWDPKESWALATWLGYLLYIHCRRLRIGGRRAMYLLLIVSFLTLQMCWWGVNYLPAARESVHTYTK